MVFIILPCNVSAREYKKNYIYNFIYIYILFRIIYLIIYLIIDYSEIFDYLFDYSELLNIFRIIDSICDYEFTCSTIFTTGFKNKTAPQIALKTS